MNHYVLNDRGEPVLEPDLLTWARWLGNSGLSRRLAFDLLPDGAGLYTSFLGIDHGWSEEGPPILWETYCSRPGEDILDRYTSREDALRGHQHHLARLTGKDSRTEMPG